MKDNITTGLDTGMERLCQEREADLVSETTRLFAGVRQDLTTAWQIRKNSPGQISAQ